MECRKTFPLDFQPPIVLIGKGDEFSSVVVKDANNWIITLRGGYFTADAILGGVAGVPPTRVVIIGAGTIAEHVTRVVRGMGAEVRIFDNHQYPAQVVCQTI